MSVLIINNSNNILTISYSVQEYNKTRTLNESWSFARTLKQL